MKRTNKIIMVLAILVAGSMIATAALVPYLSNTVTTTVTVSSPMKVGISLGRDSWATAECYRPAVNIPAYTPPGAEVLDWPYCECDAGVAGPEENKWGTPPTYTAKQIWGCKNAGNEWFLTGGREANAPYTGGMVDAFPEGIREDGTRIKDWNDDDWTTTGTLEIGNIHGGETVTFYTMSENLANVAIDGIKELIVSNPLGVTCNDFESVKVRTDSIYGELGYGKQHPRPDDEGKTNLLKLCGSMPSCPNKIKIWSPCEIKYGHDTWGARETDVSQWTITFEEAAFGTYTFTYRVIP